MIFIELFFMCIELNFDMIVLYLFFLWEKKDDL